MRLFLTWLGVYAVLLAFVASAQYADPDHSYAVWRVLLMAWLPLALLSLVIAFIIDAFRKGGVIHDQTDSRDE